jgi:hypothetical protein
MAKINLDTLSFQDALSEARRHAKNKIKSSPGDPYTTESTLAVKYIVSYRRAFNIIEALIKANTSSYSEYIEHFLNAKAKQQFGMITDTSKLRVGDKVRYQPEHYGEDKWENGMVKSLPDHDTDQVRVVYNCNGDWKDFENYTSALTHKRDLFIGWKI